MSDDYLWDRTGEPDAELAHLEEVLGTLRWCKSPRRSNLTGNTRARRIAMAIAVAAVLFVCVGAALLMHMRGANALTSWQFSLSGERPKYMHAGQLVQTSKDSRGTLQSELVGKVDIEPNSRLRLLAASGDEQRLSLELGTIHALIWAPPARFIVNTPAAKAVDLGCEYTLQVGKSGIGLLTVEMGWVAFQWHGMESFIPAGAACTTRPGHGPDTPYFMDAPPALRSAIVEFDMQGSRQSLRAVLASVRQRDGLTLWHLLQRTHGDERAEVFDRFAELVSMPPGVTRDSILRGDRGSLDAAWNALNLGDTSWWREWKRQW